MRGTAEICHLLSVSSKQLATFTFASRQGTDAALTIVPPPLQAIDDTLNHSWSYPFCNIRDHRPKRRRVPVVPVGETSHLSAVTAITPPPLDYL